MWDELMGFVDPPTEPEPTVEPKDNINAGRFTNGSYEPNGSRKTRPPGQMTPYSSVAPTLVFPTPEEMEAIQRYQMAAWTLRQVGFQIVEEGDSIAEVLGLTKPDSYQDPATGLWL